MCVPQLQKRSINTKTLDIDQTAGSRTSVFFHQAYKCSKNMDLIFCKLEKLKKHEFNFLQA